MLIDAKRIQAVFLAAAEIADPADRAKFLDGACDGDAELRSRVEALLRAHDQPDSLLDHPAVAPLNTELATTRTVGREGDAAADNEALTFLAPPTRPDALGRLGHYEVLQVLGRGGFGIVFRAFDEILQRVVALKVMAPQLAATSPARKRFLREARSSAQVRHENVVQVYEVAEQPLPYLAMEFIPGETLQQKLDRTGPLEVPEVLRIGRQIAEGLAAAHATDLIHRDIKPGNVLLEGGQHKVKITDFGLARTADDASISQSGIIAGTPMYMAPEQAQGQTLDQRADLFSLGSVLYQMVAGRPPFRANGTLAVLKRVAEDTPRAIREIIPETPQWLCDIIAKLHAKDPDDRYQSAREVADVLADCEAQLKANARLKDYSRIPRSKPQRFGRQERVVLAVAVLLAVIAFAVIEFAGVMGLFRDRGPGPAANTPFDAKEAQESVLLPTKELPPQGPGWVDLFNGKNLDGWSEFGSKATWIADNGILRGAGRAGYLVSDRGYGDFHLRAEVRLRARTDFGILFHTDRVAANAAEPTASGHGVQFSYYGPVPVGFIGMDSRITGETRLTWAGIPMKPDEWLPFDMVVHHDAVQAHIASLGPSQAFPKSSKAGPIILWLAKDDSVIELRNIRIMDLSTGEPNAKPSVEQDEGLLQGAWQAIGGETNGKKLDEQLIPSQMNVTLTFTGARVDVMTKKLNQNTGWGGLSFHLNPGANPKSIRVFGPNEEGRMVGIYKLDGADRLTLCYVDNPKTLDYPKDFSTNPGDGRTFLVFKKVPDQSAPKSAKPAAPPLAVTPFTDADVQRIAALPAAEQFVEVRKELMRRNPGFGFGGQVERKIENGVVTEFRIVTDQVTDIAPIRVWSALRVLDCRGTDTNFRPNGQLEDLTPLEGMNLAALTHLRLSNTQVGDAGLATFKGCKNLLELDLWSTKLTDAGLANFKDCKSLTVLNLGNTRVSDAGLVHFHDCKALTHLILAWTKVSDAGLANFKDCKNLTELWLPNTQAGDAGMVHFQVCKALTRLNLAGTKVSDVGVANFKDCKNLKYLYVDGTQVDDAGLANFKGMRLMELNIDDTAITDLTPLQGMPLEHVRLTPKNITRGLDILHDMKSLKTIGIRWRKAWPAAEFWERYDKGELK